MRVLIVGDVVGSTGRDILKSYLEKVRDSYDLIVINGENAASGKGITGKIAEEFISYGVDAITTGNHIWDKKEIFEYLPNATRLVRPLNYTSEAPGSGCIVVTAKTGEKVAVISLQGRVFMGPAECPFKAAKKAIEELKGVTNNIIIDVHAEATSEKIALGKYLDGEISLLYGTHTHVQTADNEILTGGTGYITDVGMTGSTNGVIGTKAEAVIYKFITALPAKFEVESGNPELCGLDVEIIEGKCTKIERIKIREV
jgi:2',3'-cyclic-nucleotide 2'-phosphodiesterase